jgi:hypothetical protein
MSMRHSSWVVIAAATAVAVLALAGCGGPEPGGDGASVPDPVRLYGSDGVMQDSLASSMADPSLLAGMKGTSPQGPLPAEFTNRLLEIDPSLESFPYAGETYDAVVIGALASEVAGTPEPEVVRGYVNGVTTGGDECTSVAACLELARSGERFAYRGISLRRGGFTELGQPSTATYATLHFGADGTVDPARTEYVGAGDAAAATDADGPEPGPRPTAPQFRIEPLRFGGLLPRSGAFPVAARLAVDDINDAGGVFGVDVEWRDGDDGGTDAGVALDTLAAHIEAGVHVIIGAAASGTTEVVQPEAAAAKRILISPASSRADLVANDHAGYFFRTAPPDDLQASALADIMLRDGARQIVILAQDEPYARGLQGDVLAALARFGVPDSDVTTLTYGPPESDGAAVPGVVGLAGEVVAAGPDAVLMVGYGEAGQLVQAMVDAGLPR